MSTLSISRYFPFTGIKIVSQNVHAQASSTLIQMRPDRRYRPVCHACGSSDGIVHSKGYRRVVRDLNMAGAETWLQVEYRKVWCPHCNGARVERLSCCGASQRVTYRMARYIYELCKHLSVKTVAEHLGLNPQTIRAIDRMFLEEEFGRTDYSDLSIIAIDEIALKKGHCYMTVVLDYMTGRVVWMGENRDKDTVDLFFSGMTPEQKALIKAVAMDMWQPYLNRVRHHCPRARIVYDFFHLVRSFGLVIDKVRRAEYVKADAEGKAVLKGSRYVLLKNAVNLTKNQRAKLKDVLAANETLTAMYILKDQLKELYHYKARWRCAKAVDAWCEMAQEIEGPKMAAFVRHVRKHKPEILNHCDYSIGTSGLEGVNNKIKLIKRRAYGYHDSQYFALKIKQAFPGKDSTNFIG